MRSSFPNPLTEKEEQYYVKLLEENDPAARLVLIEHNLKLVAHIAKKYVGPMTTQDDLISIGTIGLIKAVNTYTSKKSTRLATYAAKCIENEILMSIRASKRIKHDILGTDTDEIIDSISLKIQSGKLHQAINHVLTPREKTVIICRYGLDGRDPRPQREIAEQLSISRSYVSRIEKKALEKLKNYLEE